MVHERSRARALRSEGGRQLSYWGNRPLEQLPNNHSHHTARVQYRDSWNGPSGFRFVPGAVLFIALRSNNHLDTPRRRYHNSPAPPLLPQDKRLLALSLQLMDHDSHLSSNSFDCPNTTFTRRAASQPSPNVLFGPQTVFRSNRSSLSCETVVVL